MRSPSTGRRWQIATDAVLIAAAWTLAWLLRFDQGRPVYYDRYLEWQIILIVVGIKITVFALAGFYNRWWRYVSTRDMWTALRGVRPASLATFSSSPSSSSTRRACRRASGSSTCSCASRFVAGSRLLARTLIERPLPGQVVARGKEAIVVGAGDAAQLVVKEMLRNPALG